MPKKKTILITAGPTIEPLDPVRYFSNHSTGKMGYELAKAAERRGHRVVLISGPTSLAAPKGVRFIPVKTAMDMKKAAVKVFKAADCAIMAAAVSDFRPSAFRKKKIKKLSHKGFLLELKRNPDVISALAKIKNRRLLAGYALETENLIKNAKRKLKEKNLDVIVANKVSKNLCPFGNGAKNAVIIDNKGGIKRLKGFTKARISQILLDKLQALW